MALMGRTDERGHLHHLNEFDLLGHTAADATVQLHNIPARFRVGIHSRPPPPPPHLSQVHHGHTHTHTHTLSRSVCEEEAGGDCATAGFASSEGCLEVDAGDNDGGGAGVDDDGG